MQIIPVGKVQLNILDETHRPPMTDARIFTPEKAAALLDLVRTLPESQYGRAVAEEGSSFFAFHLSGQRANLVRTLNIPKGSRILEIGSGCGALTAALSERASELICLESSREECRINAERNKDRDGIRIYCGDGRQALEFLQEQKETFDYIVMVDAFPTLKKQWEATYYSPLKAEKNCGKAEADQSRSELRQKDSFLEGGDQVPSKAQDYSVHELFSCLESLLAQDGTLALAEPNRLGFRYFSGWKEPYSGAFFEGIEGYPLGNDADTLSGKEWARLLKANWDGAYTFYYPYPDEQYPEAVYSDQIQPGGSELNSNDQTFDQKRIRLFYDERVLRSLTEEGLFADFTNAFLILFRKKEAGKNVHLLYNKFSTERAPEFALYTEVLKQEKDGAEAGYQVRKYPAVPAARQHLQSLSDKEKLLQNLYLDQKIDLNRCTWNEAEGCEEIEYITGTSYEELADQILAEQGPEACENFIRNYLDRVIPQDALVPFKATEAYRRIFENKSGDCCFCKEGVQSLPVSDVDMIMANMIRVSQGDGSCGELASQGHGRGSGHGDGSCGESNTVIRDVLFDYEWTFDFPIPADYLRYRILHYYLETSPVRLEALGMDLYSRFGLDETCLAQCRTMEKNFQDYIARDCYPLRDIGRGNGPTVSGKETISPETTERTEKSFLYRHPVNFKDFERNQMIQIFESRGEGFSEKNSFYMRREDNPQTIVLHPDDQVTELRVDPGNLPCLCRILQVTCRQMLADESVFTADQDSDADKMVKPEPGNRNSPTVMPDPSRPETASAKTRETASAKTRNSQEQECAQSKAEAENLPWGCNGQIVDGDQVVFDTEDPMFSFKLPQYNRREVTVKVLVDPLDAQAAHLLAEAVKKKDQTCGELQTRLGWAQERLGRIENTGAYKLYKKLRH